MKRGHATTPDEITERLTLFVLEDVGVLLVDEHALGALRPPPTPTLLLLPQPPPPLFVLLIAAAAASESLLGVIVGRRGKAEK